MGICTKRKGMNIPFQILLNSVLTFYKYLFFIFIFALENSLLFYWQIA